MRLSRPRWVAPATLGALVLLAAVTLVAYTLNRQAGAGAPRRVAVAPPAPTVFVPIASDGDDLSSGVQIERLDHPGFQFGTGGATLTVLARDRDSGRPLSSARVWLTLAPRAFAPAAALVAATTDARGRASVAHLAPGQYMLAAARPVAGAPGPAPYALSSRPLTIGAADTITATLSLRRLATGAPDRRRGAARNVIVVEFNGIYAETWQHDHSVAAPTIRRLAAAGTTATQVWAGYGWPLIDDTVLATGGYPAWRLFDPWPRLVTWGEQDGIDQATWYGQDGVPGIGRADFWGQDSVFDVARRFGLATAWLGADERRPPHLNRAALTVAQTLGPPVGWEAALATMLDRLARGRRGFLLYVDLAPPPAPRGEQEPSPAVVGGRYQQTVSLYDAFAAVLVRQLAADRLTRSTALVLTAGEAQAGHTNTANYYGLGVTGRGTSLHVPLILHGPGIARGRRWDRPMGADAIAPTVTALLGLPPPADARAAALPLVPSVASPTLTGTRHVVAASIHWDRRRPGGLSPWGSVAPLAHAVDRTVCRRSPRCPAAVPVDTVGRPSPREAVIHTQLSRWRHDE